MQEPPLPLLRRLRRNRSSAGIRALVQETRLTAADLIAPYFVKDGAGSPEAIASMPGVSRLSIDDLCRQAETLYSLGVPALAIFPKVEAELKDASGSYALREDGWTLRAITALRRAVPDLLIICDVALDPYTSHGHDGILNTAASDVDNDATVRLLVQMAVLQARAGADIVAPSDMMDGRVRAIREALDAAGYQRTLIMAYAAKFASAYYGPFREAVGSAAAAGTRALDKRSYQLNPANSREALLEARLDEEEGADILMVKPAGPYLDILSQVRAHSLLPLAAYQVSGEYAQIAAAAQLGWLDRRSARDESLLAIKRAGADMILTYFAKEVAEDLRRVSDQ